MMFSRTQIAFIFFFIAIFLALYLLADTKSDKHTLLEKSRVLKQESTDIRLVINEAKNNLTTIELASIENLETLVDREPTDSSRVLNLQDLAGKWFDFGFPPISGYYAEEIARILKDDDQAWAITGTTFAYGLKKSSEEKILKYCFTHAIEAFENAASIAPEDLSHRINMALVYTDFPQAENPMKGIQMLLDLNKKHPENVKVINQLGNLAMKTGQFEKAVERYQQVLSLEDRNKTANCMIAEAYKNLGLEEKNKLYTEKCNSL